MIKSNPIPARWVTHKLENNNTKELSHCCEGSKPHVRFPSLGIKQRDWEYLGNLALKSVGFNYRTTTGLWETKTPIMDCTTKSSTGD